MNPTNSLAKVKFWMEQGWQIVGVFNIALLSLIAVPQLETILPFNASVIISILVIGTFASVIGLGYVLDKTGFVTKHMGKQSSLNPFWKEAIERLERIERKLNENDV